MAKLKKPGSIIIDGLKWPVQVLKVVGRDSDGSPRTFQLVRHDESTHVNGGEAFFAVYAHPALAATRKN